MFRLCVWNINVLTILEIDMTRNIKTINTLDILSFLLSEQKKKSLQYNYFLLVCMCCKKNEEKK